MKTREEQRMMLAGMAMQGLLSNPGGPIQANGMSGWGLTNCKDDDVAWYSVHIADVLLAELDRTAPKPETPIPDADGWIPHKPGDAMPCDGDLWVHAKYRDGLSVCCFSQDFRWNAAKESEDPECEIIAWKPAK